VTLGSLVNDSLYCRKTFATLQATSLMLNFDEVNFTVIVAKYISAFGSHLNSVGEIQQQNCSCTKKLPNAI
jgi:hypothetical protein